MSNKFEALLKREAQPQPAPAPVAVTAEDLPDTVPVRALLGEIEKKTTPTKRTAKAQRLDRAGKKVIALHLDPDVVWTLKALAVEERKTLAALMDDAINGLFLAKGKKAIAGR